MKHYLVTGVLVVVMTIMVYLLLTNIGLLPPQASTQAETIDRLFNLHFFLISFLFSLITVLIGYSLIVFRKRPDGPDEGRPFSGSTKLEVVWTLIPLATVLMISYVGSQSLAEILRVDPQAMEVKVTAGQWYWLFEYPDYGIQSNSLYLPVDEQVLLKMTSRDVIHSFWVPEFRVKQDVLPGENLVKELRFTPTIIGDYKVRCAEMCGGSHAYMESPVVVLSRADFDAWVLEQSGALADDPVARGRQVAKVNGCVGCHSDTGVRLVGPTWLGIFGRQTLLTDGSIVIADENYLRNSIINTNDQIVDGFTANIMPQNYADLLTDEQISDLIEYMKSLK